MKKRIMCSAIMLLLLSGCTGDLSLSVDATSSTPPVTTSEDVSISSDTSMSSYIEDTSVELDDWNDDIKEVFKQVLEDENLVPYIKVDSYTFEVKQEQGIDYVDVLLNGIHTETIVEEYSQILKNEGFYVSQPSLDYLAYKELDLEDNLYIQFNVLEDELNDIYQLHLMAYRVQERVTVWPDDLLYTMFFETLPSFPSKAYEVSYYFDSSKVTYVFSCYAHYVEDNGYNLYKDTLKENGFNISEKGDYYEATSDVSNLNVVVYDYDSLSNLVYLRVTCNRLHFPNFMFSLLLEEEIPIIEGDGYEYDYYFFDNSEGQLNSYTQEKYVPVLYVYNVENDYYLDYLDRLISNGWNKDADGTYKKIINAKQHQLFLVYSETYKSMAIFVIK